MIQISNQEIRRLWLQSNGLYNRHDAELNVLSIIKELGFVQIDSIQNVSRAHHHIIWSRNHAYKEHMLDELLLERGKVFEHFTHDASLIPLDFYPMWQGSYKRMKNKLDRSKYYKDILDEDAISEILSKISKEGALNIKDFESPSYKTTLDYLWYCGVLTTAYRKSFRKYYDLSENIICKDLLNKKITNDEQVDWLCREALNRLSVASVKEIRNFWGTLSMDEVKSWTCDNKDDFVEVEWENSEGKYTKSFASLDILKRLKNVKTSDARIQIINPFDPAIRDRIRLEKIFGFKYKIEIFVPKEKRIWGYYVYPLLQDNKFIGRIELKADRKKGELKVLNFYKEEGVAWSETQEVKLRKELSSFALLAGITQVSY